MSATALALIPCFIVYLIAQRYFVQGVNITQVYTGR
jgi:ABC-type glycerol-3-phosphate transport system permease component